MKETVRQVDVVGVGLNATDTIIRLPQFPAFNSKVEFTSAQVLLGGQAASALVACARWGLTTRYIGKVGDDDAGDRQRRELAEEGVEARLIKVKNCASQWAYILVDEASGERTILWRRDARLKMEPKELKREWIAAARALHVDGHDTETAAVAAQWARDAGIPVTADVDNVYPGVEKLLENVDYLMASQEFPERLTGKGCLREALPELVKRFGCRVAGATLGSDGAVAWDGTRFTYAPAYQVNVVDTTGAGDIFHGAFAYALLRDWPLDRLLEFSCAAAGLNCTALGARGGVRPVQEIEAFARDGPRRAPTHSGKEFGVR